MPVEKPARESLELEVGHGTSVDLTQLLGASTPFSAIIREIAKSYTGHDRGIRWVVEVRPGSVRLPVVPEVVGDQVAPSAAAELPNLIGEGIAQLQREAVRPAHFTDGALEQLRELAKQSNEGLPIFVTNGHGRTALTAVAVNIDKILGKSRASVGTVEGRLESLSVHGGSEFTIWPSVGNGVKCSFGRHLRLEEVLPAIGKRVAARGQIKSRPDGTREALQVHSLRVLNETPIDADDVRGMLQDREAADW